MAKRDRNAGGEAPPEAATGEIRGETQEEGGESVEGLQAELEQRDQVIADLQREMIVMKKQIAAFSENSELAVVRAEAEKVGGNLETMELDVEYDTEVQHMRDNIQTMIDTAGNVLEYLMKRQERDDTQIRKVNETAADMMGKMIENISPQPNKALIGRMKSDTDETTRRLVSIYENIRDIIMPLHEAFDSAGRKKGWWKDRSSAEVYNRVYNQDRAIEELGRLFKTLLANAQEQKQYGRRRSIQSEILAGYDFSVYTDQVS